MTCSKAAGPTPLSPGADHLEPRTAVPAAVLGAILGTEGKTPAEGRRALKRKISNAIYARLRADAQRAATPAVKDPGGQPGNDPEFQRGQLTPRTPALRTSHSRTRPQTTSAQPSN